VDKIFISIPNAKKIKKQIFLNSDVLTNGGQMKTFQFYYDVVCPYAYLASTQVEKVAQNCNAKVIFTPVLLGGIYKETKAPQGKDGSATDVMSPSKKISISNDLKLQLKRYQVTMKTPKRFFFFILKHKGGR
jgi:2-hydroxychromene-2-carboxylate isomerase